MLLKQTFFNLSLLQPVNKRPGAQSDEESDDTKEGEDPMAEIVEEPIDKEKTKGHQPKG